jgi:predicted permease
VSGFSRTIMPLDNLKMDVRYALRGIRRAPLFSASVAATIGLGLGVLCSAFTILNAYVLKTINLPDPEALYFLDWDTATARNHGFRLSDFEAATRESPFALAAGQSALVMKDGAPLPGMLVTGNYFNVLGNQPILGRLLTPADAPVPGGNAVAVLSEYVWRARFGADPAIVGKQVELGRQSFEVVGVIRQSMMLPSQSTVGFYVPLTMARAFEVPDPWVDPDASPLIFIGRLRADTTREQANAWFNVWLRQRYPPGSESEPVAVRLGSLARIFPLTGGTWTMLMVITTAFGMVLLVACANVANLMLARGFSRQREIAVRLSLGASRQRVVRQLVIESLVLAVPAAAVGLALTFVTARAFPALIVATFPKGVAPVELALRPLDPNLRVLVFLFVAAVISAVAVALAPGLRVTRGSLVRAARGEVTADNQRSRLRSGLVAMQIGACVMFLVGAIGLIDEARRLGNPDPGLSYERVAEVRIAPRFRGELAVRLTSDPSIERVAVSWRQPLAGTLAQVGVVASSSRIEQAAGFMVVSPDYFPLFDIQVVRGRAFTVQEADDGAAVAMVSAATAKTLWPGLDPIGQTLEILPVRERSQRQPDHTRVRIIGVTEDVVSGTMIEGIDRTCIYFATGVRAPGEMSLLVRGRTDSAALRDAVVRAVDAFNPDLAYEIRSMRVMLGLFAWVFSAFSVTASLLGVIGLMLAFSGTYAVVAFLVAMRTPEFGIRMALGATVRGIVSGMMGETLKIALIGLGAGLVVAYALLRAVGAVIETIPAFGPRPFLIGTGIVLAATMVAALLPSLRAARIDPSKALRAE